MLPVISDYEIRMVDIQGLRNVYLPEIVTELGKLNYQYVPWSDEIDFIFEWMIGESLGKYFFCKIHRHEHDDLAKTIYQTFKDFPYELFPYLDAFNLGKRKECVRHVKFVVAGSLMLIFIQYRVSSGGTPKTDEYYLQKHT